MVQNGVDQLVEKWLNDADFRERMKRDPEGTVKSCGILLDAEEWATVRNIVMSISEEELRARISRSPLG